MKFNNTETQLMAKWHGNKIEEIILENPNQTEVDLVCILSEKLENIVKEDLSHMTEGYISELIGESFDKVDYKALIQYFQPDEVIEDDIETH